MLSARGRRAAVLAVTLQAAAWAFGAPVLVPPAVGLLGAVALAWAWVRLPALPVSVRRRIHPAAPVEGDETAIELEAEPGAGLPVRSVRAVDAAGRLGAVRVELRRSCGALLGQAALGAVARGRHRLGPVIVELADPFGLAARRVELAAPGTLVVLPRTVSLDRLFTDAGALDGDGRRVLLRRPSGFDLHSVREHEHGESLRLVHWRTTARRGQLMVKQLEDAPRDEVAVVLDGAAGIAAGTAPDSSFDAQVRAAASLVVAQAHRGRRAVLLAHGAQGIAVEREPAAALELLAGAEADGALPLDALAASDAALRSAEIVLVTARLDTGTADRLAARASGAAVVYVDAASWAATAGARPLAAREPQLLRLRAAGVSVAVVRRGGDLAAALGGALARERGGRA